MLRRSTPYIDPPLLETGDRPDLPADADGIFRSRVFPGLWLDAAALLAGDARQMLEVVERGTATPEHAAFVGRLQRGK